MRPGKGAGRASCLAMNPYNLQDSIHRRLKLVQAFEALPEDARADLLEAVETLIFTARISVSAERDEARDILREVYRLAGWEQGR